MPTDVALPLRVGARTVWTVRRRLVRRRLSLDEALGDAVPALLPLAGHEHGYLITGLPEAVAQQLILRRRSMAAFVRQRYRRSFARLDQAFDLYFEGFSAKSRSTCRRKLRRFAERSGGTIHVRMFAAEHEILGFYEGARTVSRKSYQERLLDSGLPAGAEALADMRASARAGKLRSWLLYLDGAPIAYLHAPAEGDALVYAHLGYDPDFADLSPGTVLQLEAMRMLMAERRFRLFDFTEGEGQHKRLFSTGGIDCVDLLLLRPTLANLAIGHALGRFDDTVAFAKKVVSAFGVGTLVRRLRR